MADITSNIISHEELPTPGMLRLLAELRVMIYRYLSNDKTSKVYRIPDTHELRPTNRLFILPVLQVCQRIRHEAIPIWYGAHYLHIFVPTRNPPACDPQLARWIQTIDRYALFSMKGVQIQHLPHSCKTWAEEIRVQETTIIGLQDTLSRTTANYIGGTCRYKELFDIIRDALLRDFGRNVRARPEAFKEELLQLVVNFSFSDCFRPSLYSDRILESWAQNAQSGGPLLHPMTFAGNFVSLRRAFVDYNENRVGGCEAIRHPYYLKEKHPERLSL